MDEPVFVVDGLDVTVFRTVADAEAYLEAIDVSNGEYDAACDSSRKLSLEVEGRRVVVHSAEDPPRLLPAAPGLSS